MNNNEKIRDILVTRRTQLGMSMSELARRLNIPKSTLSRYENLKHQYPLDEITHFSEILDLPVVDILGINPIESKKEIEKTINIIKQLEEPRQKAVYNYAEQQLHEQKQESTIEENNVTSIHTSQKEPLVKDALAAHVADGHELKSTEEIIDYLTKVKNKEEK